ncbi:MAG: ribonuclease HI family protein [Bacteroidales bacterium]|nr:ribonuclease HI family protein [Candidatus Latescibacterota bacterium]
MTSISILLRELSKGKSLALSFCVAGFETEEKARKAIARLAESIGDDVTEAAKPAMGCLTELIVKTDGAARGNPGPASSAAVVFNMEGEVLLERSVLLGETTNNEAEYRGLILGLDLARELGALRVIIQMDSQLVVRQMTGEYRIRKAHLEKLASIAKNKASVFESVTFQHIPRAENKDADRLANTALDNTD